MFPAHQGPGAVDVFETGLQQLFGLGGEVFSVFLPDAQDREAQLAQHFGAGRPGGLHEELDLPRGGFESLGPEAFHEFGEGIGGVAHGIFIQNSRPVK